jgi:hypothetical protein
MPTLKSRTPLPNKHRTASRTAAVVIAALAAIAVTVLILALSGARATIPPNQTAHIRSASAHPAPTHRPRSRKCHAVLDPMTGQMHGGCPPDQTNANPATP